MPEDIFEFWSAARMPTDAYVHPVDAAVLNRIDHGFDLTGVPGCWMGPLLTAKVVLLFKAPGRWNPADSVEPTVSIIRDWQARTRGGREPLPDQQTWEECWDWWTKRTADFGYGQDGDWQDIVDKVAFLNIAPYHSSPPPIKDSALLPLPSSKVTLNWAHNRLFPAARLREQVVVCLLGARKWGLQRGYGDGFLFAPRTNPAGYIYRRETSDADMYEAIVAAVSGILGT